MSHQSSQSQSLRDTASSATNEKGYDENKDKNNFTKDDHGNIVKKGDLKHKLNEAARYDKGEGGEEEGGGGVIDKVMSYIPLLSTKQEKEQDSKCVVGKEGPPNRPDHDVQVEQFLRGQYHSRSGDGMPDPDKE